MSLVSPRLVSLLLLAMALAACSGGSSSTSSEDSPPSPPPPAQFTIQGSVGDGPIVGATIEVRDANGQLIAQTTSDSTADYTIDLPADTALPVRVQAIGGTDLVTGRAPDFTLEAAVLGTNSQTINVSPFHDTGGGGIRLCGCPRRLIA